MPQNAYMEQTVFPYSHLRRRKREHEKEEKDSAKQRQKREINEGERGE